MGFAMTDIGLSSNETERRRRQRLDTSIDRYGRYTQQPLRVSIREAQALLSCTKEHLYTYLRRGLIRTSGTRRKKWLCFEDLQRIARGESAE
jgi:hypothetical protein